MKGPRFFHLISSEFKRAQIRFILIGGFAVTAYGYNRATRDFDILMTENEFEKAIPILEKMGYRQMSRTSVCAQFQHKNLDLDFIDLDVVFVEEPTFEAMWKAAKETEILGNKFFIPALDHLIAMKLHALKNNPKRDWDMTDLVQLIKRGRIQIDSEEYRKLCLKHGTEELYSTLKRKLKNG